MKPHYKVTSECKNKGYVGVQVNWEWGTRAIRMSTGPHAGKTLRFNKESLDAIPKARYDANKKKFIGQCGYNGVQIYLGAYDNPHEPHEAWRKKKIEIVNTLKDRLDEVHPNLFGAILNRYEERLYS